VENIELLRRVISTYRNMPMPSSVMDDMLHLHMQGLEAALADEEALHEAVEQASAVALEHPDTLCGEDHRNLARWLRELQNRRRVHYRLTLSCCS